MISKTILVGIDGGTWNILKPLIAEGALPHFEEIVRDGVSGVLRSTIPYTTLPGWTSMFTGVNPGKHGIIENVIRINNEFVICNSMYRMVKTVWQFLHDHGYSSTVVNDPVTYPPDKIGIHVTGLLTPGASKNYVMPSNLTDVIEKVSDGYTPDIQHNYYDNLRKNREVAFKQVKDYGLKIAKVGMHLLKNYSWDMAAVIFTSTDRMQHFFWHQPDYLRRHYQEIDSYLGDFMNLASTEQANVIIASDHGFTGVKEFFFINALLYRKGLLKPLKEGVLTSGMRRAGITRASVVNLLRKNLPLYRIIRRLTPRSLKKSLPLSERMKIDHYSSKIYAFTNLGLFINSIDEKELEALLKEISTVQSSDGIPFIKEILRRDEVIWGPYAERAPDIIILPNSGYKVRNELYLDARLSSKPYYADYGITFTGEHEIDGILMAIGPDMARGKQIETKRVWDIAPTLLHMADLPIPDYFDGKVIKDIFRNSSPLYTKTISITRRSMREELRDKIKTLKGLGRLGT